MVDTSNNSYHGSKNAQNVKSSILNTMLVNQTKIIIHEKNYRCVMVPAANIFDPSHLDSARPLSVF